MNKKIVFLALVAGVFSSKVEARYQRPYRAIELREIINPQTPLEAALYRMWLQQEQVWLQLTLRQHAQQSEYEIQAHVMRKAWLNWALPHWQQQGHGQQGQQVMLEWNEWHEKRYERQWIWLQQAVQQWSRWSVTRHRSPQEWDQVHEEWHQVWQQQHLVWRQEWCQKQLEWDTLTHGRQECQQGW